VAIIDVEILLTEASNFEGIRTLSHHVLASTNFVEQSCGKTKGMAMGLQLFLSLLTSDTGLEQTLYRHLCWFPFVDEIFVILAMDQRVWKYICIINNINQNMRLTMDTEDSHITS
jgi:hypothetical protein